jgi:hypothetical protein
MTSSETIGSVIYECMRSGTTVMTEDGKISDLHGKNRYYVCY